MSSLTFVILAYRESPYLRECIQSLLQQSHTGEIIMCTSTPNDFLKAIASEYNIPLHVNSKAEGIASDWNYALQMANTPFVTLAHQDDIYQREYAAQCLKVFEKNPEALICFTDYTELENEKTRPVSGMLYVKKLMLRVFMPFNKVKSRFWKKTMLSTGNPIAAPGVMYNKLVLGDFQFDKNFVVSLDWEAWYRMASIPGSFIYINQPLLQHRIHAGSSTTNAIEDSARAKEDLILFKKFWPGIIAGTLANLYAWSYKSNKIEKGN